MTFLADLYSKITGRPVARVVERRPGCADKTTTVGREIHHGDGRQSVDLRTETITLNREQTEAALGLPINDLRRMIYERERAGGTTHEEAVGRLFPNGKVTV